MQGRVGLDRQAESHGLRRLRLPGVARDNLPRHAQAAEHVAPSDVVGDRAEKRRECPQQVLGLGHYDGVDLAAQAWCARDAIVGRDRWTRPMWAARRRERGGASSATRPWSQVAAEEDRGRDRAHSPEAGTRRRPAVLRLSPAARCARTVGRAIRSWRPAGTATDPGHGRRPGPDGPSSHGCIASRPC